MPSTEDHPFTINTSQEVPPSLVIVAVPSPSTPTSSSTSSVPTVTPLPAIQPIEHSNANLLKLNTHDKYSTSNSLKRQIAANCPPPLTGGPSIEQPLFPGLLRMNKNPSNPHVFLAFETAAERDAAKDILCTRMAFRKKIPWVEAPVTDYDRQLTIKGGKGAGEGAGAAGQKRGISAPDEGSNRQRKRKECAEAYENKTGAPPYLNVAQWAAMPYFQQLAKKKSHCVGVLKQIANNGVQNNYGTYRCGTLVENFSVLASPMITGYRNNVNLSCGYDKERRPAIGFLSGSVVEGHAAVDDITGYYYHHHEQYMSNSIKNNNCSDENNTHGNQNMSHDSTSSFHEKNTTIATEKKVVLMPTTHAIAVHYARAIMSLIDFLKDKYPRITLGMFDKNSHFERSNATQGKEDKTKNSDPSTHPEQGAEKNSSEGGVIHSSKSLEFWRRVHIRHSVHGDVLLDLELDDSHVPDEILSNIKNEIVKVLKNAETTYNRQPHPVLTSESFPNEQYEIKSCKLVSLQCHFHTGNTTCLVDTPREVLYGDLTLKETICGMKFSLSPNAFFQVNTANTERMIEHLAKCAKLTSSTTLLDLCCGTGVIGICLAKYAKRVVGIEMVTSAVENAKENAKRNDVKNITFHASTVESILPDVLRGMPQEDLNDIVAIFDPPRAGMHPSVLKVCRDLQSLKNIIYISCDQNALVNDCPTLTKPPTKKYRGTPYVIEGAFGVDLFPNTPHVEMAIVMRRLTTQQYAQPTVLESSVDI